MANPLKLRAFDAEDLQALAACLQDALVTLADMAWIPAERRFVMVANRFCWECGGAQATPEPGAAAPSAPDSGGADAAFAAEEPETGEPGAGEPPFERVHSGICFDGVTQVRRRGIDPQRRDRVLSLLTMTLDADKVLLVFAGDAAVELTIERLNCRLDDLGEAWPTSRRPQHPLDEDGDAG
jgi:hypothetical protein